ncbi:MAG: MjaI family restriction endonuclease, partial [Desulfobaccales bacterium]
NERWGLNKKASVGPVSLWIRECDPKNINEWKGFYFNKLETMLKEKAIDLKPEEYIRDLGLKLYTKISEVVREEIDEISEDDCVNFVYELVIRRTYDGYHTEKETVYGQLQDILNVPIKSAPDEWDRLYNVDFLLR